MLVLNFITIEKVYMFNRVVLAIRSTAFVPFNIAKHS